jgi:hypothetical protein
MNTPDFDLIRAVAECLEIPEDAAAEFVRENPAAARRLFASDKELAADPQSAYNQAANPASEIRANTERNYEVHDGIIRSPGKFEGEAIYVPYLWNLSLEGGADNEREFSGGYWCEFKLTPTDTSDWPELEGRDIVRLVENHDGFVYEVDWAPEEEHADMASIRPSWVACIVCNHNRALKSKGSICKACRERKAPR